jgi:dihydroorotate dehydrogenase
LYSFLIKPLLFLFQPEKAHHITFNTLSFLFKIPGMSLLFQSMYDFKHPALKRTVFGITFPNPVGLAAGFDKDAKMIDPFSHLGFGSIEIGTITPLAQPGNEQPRLFRLPKDEAIINRMGFNNGGMHAAAIRLKNRKSNVIVGGNIGKNKITPNEEAEQDYIKCFHTLYPYVDYFVVNVSSPNTPGLRALQEKEPLMNLLVKLQSVNNQQVKAKPILLKIAPDLTNEQLDDIVEIVLTTRIAGVIATNTTISRADLTTEQSSVEAIGAGGLSGKPLLKRSTEVVRYLHLQSKGAFPIVAVGGIHCAADAIEKLKAGASLVQLYTGFIYEGPSLIKEINKEIVAQGL